MVYCDSICRIMKETFSWKRLKKSRAPAVVADMDTSAVRATAATDMVAAVAVDTVTVTAVTGTTVVENTTLPATTAEKSSVKQTVT